MSRLWASVWLCCVALALSLSTSAATEWFPLFDCDGNGEAECYCEGIGTNGPIGCQEVVAVVSEPAELPKCGSCGGTWSPQPLLPAPAPVSRDGYFEDFTEVKPWYSRYWNAMGFLEISTSEEGKVTNLECPTTANEITYEVDMVFTKHTHGMAGVMFMSSEEDDWSYGIFFDPEGRFYLYWISPSGGTWNAIRSYQASAVKRGLREINHLVIELTEVNTYVSFNGSAVGTANAVMPLGGHIRLAVANFEDETIARFDNLHFHSPDASPMED